jgi:hypothetical protein
LSRRAYGQFHRAIARTAWARSCRHDAVLRDGSALLGSATRYDFTVWLDGTRMPACGLGDVMSHRGADGGRALLDVLLRDASRDGCALAILFPPPVPIASVADLGFVPLPLRDVQLRVEPPPRRGAPMTTIRGGDTRDLAAIAAIGATRAARFRFHLERDADFVQHAITRRRLLAGLGTPDQRRLEFFIAEEGTTAAAYVVISVVGSEWTVEECGDRDASGARVGAILQALLARDPTNGPETIRGWLPPGFQPPQVSCVAMPSKGETILIAPLTGDHAARPLTAEDVLFWHSDLMS